MQHFLKSVYQNPTSFKYVEHERNMNENCNILICSTGDNLGVVRLWLWVTKGREEISDKFEMDSHLKTLYLK